MSLKSIERKKAKLFVVDGRRKGLSDQEIYNELANQYADKKSIALLITGIATDERKQKYGLQNWILVGLLGLSILFKLVLVVNLAITQTPWLLLLALVVPLLTGYFMYEIYNYNGPVYRICGVLALVGFLQSLDKSNDAQTMILNLLFAGLVAGFSFYLDDNLFPNYRPSKLQKDENGDYILNG